MGVKVRLFFPYKKFAVNFILINQCYNRLKKRRVIFFMPSIGKIWNTLTDIPQFPLQGSLMGQGHWKVINIEEEGRCLYVDTSTGFVFGGPDCGNTCVELRKKGVYLAIAMPFYTAGVMAYNVGRIVPVIVYLAIHSFVEYYSENRKKTLKSTVLEHLKQMGIETGVSLRNIVRTPFYAIRMMMGCLWALVDPFNGMKIIGSFEHHWNHGKTIYEPSLHIIGFSHQFVFEGGGDPKQLRKSTYFLAPCCAYYSSRGTRDRKRICGGEKKRRVARNWNYWDCCFSLTSCWKG